MKTDLQLTSLWLHAIEMLWIIPIDIIEWKIPTYTTAFWCHASFMTSNRNPMWCRLACRPVSRSNANEIVCRPICIECHATQKWQKLQSELSEIEEYDCHYELPNYYCGRSSIVDDPLIVMNTFWLIDMDYDKMWPICKMLISWVFDWCVDFYAIK